MNKKQVLQRTAWTGVMCGLLGLTACAMSGSEDELYLGDEAAPEADTEVVFHTDADATVQSTESIVSFGESVNDSAEPCPEELDCVVADDYLTRQFETNEKVADEDIAQSRPAGARAVSVKDKMKQDAAATENMVLVSSETQKSDDGNTTTTKTVHTGADTVSAETDIVPMPAPVVVAGETVLQTTEAIPEGELTQTTDGMTETTEQVVGTPAGKMPLKKVRTTITETTTKIKKDPNAPQTSGDTLVDRIAYGDSVHDWHAESGSTLRTLLINWGTKSGWTVVWKLDRDYHLEAGVVFRGTFTDVSGALIRSFARATPAPIGTFYQGNRVLVINTQEDENER